ncbi:protein LURP-one-related 8 [Diospyros lotus]|uniref:protein LURP-one-related 8 n=1 Tax=Diospyros lotus TaxID=55363 RepID=UPI00224D0908|nr:protein LURP-one-related 8 [Diospyros lotus]
MTKVHPNAAAKQKASPPLAQSENSVAVLTVWKKSLLLNCDGYTVFDAKGNLVFRVDNYAAASKAKNTHEIILMDAAGNSLVTIRRKRLSVSDNWLVYDGETAVNPILSARKHMSLLNTKSLAHVSSCCGGGGKGSSSSSSPSSKKAMYEIKGSYAERRCTLYDGDMKAVAEIMPKEAVGGLAFRGDVFRLVVQPEIDSAVAMAIVILLDQMFGSSKYL